MNLNYSFFLYIYSVVVRLCQWVIPFVALGYLFEDNYGNAINLFYDAQKLMIYRNFGQFYTFFVPFLELQWKCSSFVSFWIFIIVNWGEELILPTPLLQNLIVLFFFFLPKNCRYFHYYLKILMVIFLNYFYYGKLILYLHLCRKKIIIWSNCTNTSKLFFI